MNAHRRAWEPACEECKAFHAEYQRRRRSSGAPRVKARADAARRNRAVRLLIARHRGEFLDLLREVS